MARVLVFVKGKFAGELAERVQFIELLLQIGIHAQAV
jgi:hypothetical protein